MAPPFFTASHSRFPCQQPIQQTSQTAMLWLGLGLGCRNGFPGFLLFVGFSRIGIQLSHLFFQAGQAVFQVCIVIAGPHDIPFHAAHFFFQ